MKRVMEVIVGLLRERVDVEKKPEMKKQRVQGFFMYHGRSLDLCIYFLYVLNNFLDKISLMTKNQKSLFLVGYKKLRSLFV